jgi:transposase
MVVGLTAKQRRELERLVARATDSAHVIRRAHVVLWSADGVAGAEIARRLQLSAEAVSRIRRRFLAGGVAGLATRPKGGRTDHAVPAATVERVIELAMSPPPAGRSRWTTRLLAKEVGLTSGCISDLLRRHGLKPHRVRTYKVSRDPDFVAKVRDIVGLYLHPPEHAVVLSVDEKTSIQALERTQPPLPLRSGRAMRHTHDYKRHGVVDLYAALEVATGDVRHRLSARHTAADFVLLETGAALDVPPREGRRARPGSETAAQVRDGSDRNLGDSTTATPPSRMVHGMTTDQAPRGPSPPRGSEERYALAWSSCANP